MQSVASEAFEGHHRLLVLDVQMKVKAAQTKRVMEKGIKWKKLKEKRDVLKGKLWEAIDWEFDGTVEDMWRKTIVEIIKCCKEVLRGYKVGTKYIEKETWWCNEEVSKVVKDKKVAYKKWQESRSQVDFEEYKRAKDLAKRKVAQAKAENFKALYDRLKTKEGEKEVYRLAKCRARKSRDVDRVKCV